uniref:Uncharacterized protein n=1 Tax=Picea glauca TaxID=3330 RepID=A0A101M246_PICGL|nr:hypothetical protein ABT39_MTgene2799 [Picea glauca]QHR87664.1 hypothetical protein Q903MT_gene1676 [Picea sitchensis]
MTHIVLIDLKMILLLLMGIKMRMKDIQKN